MCDVREQMCPNGDTDGDKGFYIMTMTKDKSKIIEFIEDVEESIRKIKNGEIEGTYIEF